MLHIKAGCKIFFSKGGKSFAGFLLDEEKGKKKELTNSKIKLL
jgi:hypothetical protein